MDTAHVGDYSARATVDIKIDERPGTAPREDRPRPLMLIFEFVIRCEKRDRYLSLTQRPLLRSTDYGSAARLKYN